MAPFIPVNMLGREAVFSLVTNPFLKEQLKKNLSNITLAIEFKIVLNMLVEMR